MIVVVVEIDLDFVEIGEHHEPVVAAHGSVVVFDRTVTRTVVHVTVRSTEILVEVVDHFVEFHVAVTDFHDSVDAFVELVFDRPTVNFDDTPFVGCVVDVIEIAVTRTIVSWVTVTRMTEMIMTGTMVACVSVTLMITLAVAVTASADDLAVIGMVL